MATIQSFLASLWNMPRDPYDMPTVPLDDNAFPAFMEIDISQDCVEIPTPLVAHFFKAKREGYTKLVFNLANGADNEGRRTFHKKTVSTILRQFYDSCVERYRIAHVVTSKNLSYYGCRGMIFDKDYFPLMLCTIEAKLTPDGNRMTFDNPRIRLSYKVFEHSDEIIEKTLIKQAIPYYSRYGVNVIWNHFNRNLPVNVVIGHMDHFIVRPATPSVSTATPELFNNAIVRYYDNQ